MGNTWVQLKGFEEEIRGVVEFYRGSGFVHYFNTTGILQHNDNVSGCLSFWFLAGRRGECGQSRWDGEKKCWFYGRWIKRLGRKEKDRIGGFC